MVDTVRKFARLLAISCTGVCLFFSSTYANETSRETDTRKQYYVDAKVLSIKPNMGIESYEGHGGGGGVGPGGRLTLVISTEHRAFNVSINGKIKDGRFLADLTVTPDKKDKDTTALDKTLDLTDLMPVTFELGRDDDNRVYRLNLVPRIIEHPLPKGFRASDLALERFHFRDSQVILNDQDYLGELNMGSSPIAWVDIPGLAKIEFSLLPLTDSQPEGILENGTVRITHKNKTRLRVTNIRNGTPSEVLPGGPYQIWVRWLEPSQTIEEYLLSQQEHLASIKKKVENGELDVPQGTIERLERAVSSDRIFQLSSGIRGAYKGDVERSKE